MTYIICDELKWGWTPDQIAQDLHSILDQKRSFRTGHIHGEPRPCDLLPGLSRPGVCKSQQTTIRTGQRLREFFADEVGSNSVTRLFAYEADTNCIDTQRLEGL
jgi:hypothetical protein